MYKVKQSNSFKKDVKLAKKRGLNFQNLKDVVTLLACNKKLPIKYQDHSLTGNFKDCRECHIQPDWLLIYSIDKNNLILHLLRTGTYSDLY